MSLIRVHFVASGVVQGVFFRASTQSKATELGLSGYIRNLEDGRVECIAEGKREKLEKLVLWARKGPDGAIVEKLDVTWEKASGEFAGFGITG